MQARVQTVCNLSTLYQHNCNPHWYMSVLFRYVPSEEKRKSGCKKTSDLTIYRKKPDPAHTGQTISKPFRVTDNPLKLSIHDW